LLVLTCAGLLDKRRVNQLTLLDKQLQLQLKIFNSTKLLPHGTSTVASYLESLLLLLHAVYAWVSVN
jgi:hypothetical protein